MNHGWRRVRRAADLGLGCIGVLMLGSAFVHWTADPSLQRHYADVGLPGAAPFVGTAQFVAGLGLILPRTRYLAGAVLAVAMFAIAARRMVHHGLDEPPYEALAIGAGVAGLLWLGRRAAARGRGERR